jgi:hypothetical protein
MTIEERLSGGHPNSLGNTLEVVEDVLKDPLLFDELFNCYLSDDEVVRLRVSNAIKRITKVHPDFLIPYKDRLLLEIAQIDQASTQWTLAQLFDLLKSRFTPDQKQQAVAVMQKNIATHDDWIVLNMTMETLGKWSMNDSGLRNWLLPHLDRLSQDPRKSVSKKAKLWLKTLTHE